jgi:hypothetical protein
VFFFFVRFSWGQILATWQENIEGAKGLERVFGGEEKNGPNWSHYEEWQGIKLSHI